MIIKWFGHCTFLLQDSLGHRILTDPYNDSVFNNLLHYNPSIVTISRPNFLLDNYSSNIKNSMILNSASIFKTSITTIYGFKSFCDNSNGIKRGENIIYKYDFDNYVIIYLGYLGHIPNFDLTCKLKNCDILFIPIGGHFTLNTTDAINLIKILCPKIVIPMYYRTYYSLPYVDGCNKFIFNMKNIIKSSTNSYEITSSNPDMYPCTILLHENNIIN
ncbi:MAG: MBL fold metallo-hydrolase [Clostridiaceae bacterium]|nr:MBL fold metallo-hydrolase [Clostridiaceae bacterium]